MSVKAVFCEECMEEIPNDEVYWEDDRLYCSRCGSEVEIPTDDLDLYDHMVSRRGEASFSTGGDPWEGEEEAEAEEEEEAGVAYRDQP